MDDGHDRHPRARQTLDGGVARRRQGRLIGDGEDGRDRHAVLLPAGRELGRRADFEPRVGGTAAQEGNHRLRVRVLFGEDDEPEPPLRVAADGREVQLPDDTPDVGQLEDAGHVRPPPRS